MNHDRPVRHARKHTHSPAGGWAWVWTLLELVGIAVMVWEAIK